MNSKFHEHWRIYMIIFHFQKNLITITRAKSPPRSYNDSNTNSNYYSCYTRYPITRNEDDSGRRRRCDIMKISSIIVVFLRKTILTLICSLGFH